MVLVVSASFLCEVDPNLVTFRGRWQEPLPQPAPKPFTGGATSDGPKQFDPVSQPGFVPRPQTQELVHEAHPGAVLFLIILIPVVAILS